jgi:hypothetical protein
MGIAPFRICFPDASLSAHSPGGNAPMRRGFSQRRFLPPRRKKLLLPLGFAKQKFRLWANA